MTTKYIRRILLSNIRGYHAKVPSIGKQGFMLSKCLTNRDKKKYWFTDVLANPDKHKNIYEKVHKPTKRASVLNNLFIENITDVLSTGDIAPEIIGSGVEIVGVKISPDYKILNVYWQIPLSKTDSSKDLQKILAMCAPKLRSDLISRNVLGKVPKIFFVQDTSNQMLLEFQKALESADMGPESESTVVPDDGFLKELLLFRSAKEEKWKRIQQEKASVKSEVNHQVETATDTEKKTESLESDEKVLPTTSDGKYVLLMESMGPDYPDDMTHDVGGLDHRKLMEKVIAAKRSKIPKKEHVATPQVSVNEDDNDDLFNKIPGQPLFRDEEREKLLIKFCIDRKVKKREMETYKKADEGVMVQDAHNDYDDSGNLEQYEPDYYDEDFNEYERN